MEGLSVAPVLEKELINQREAVMPTHDRGNIKELVKKAQLNNTTALNQLIDIFHQDIFRLVYYRLQSKSDAEDITQEIFIKAVRGLGRLKDGDKFKPWLYAIALNCVKDFNRKKLWNFFQWSVNDDDDTEPDIPDSHLNPEELIVQKEFWMHFNKVIKTLSKQEREVFTLRFLDNLCIREIAEVLKKSESTVKTHLYRAVKKFKSNHELHHLLRGGI
jgi:RNA polymerase sigma-70 factor (ECF subfamily)